MSSGWRWSNAGRERRHKWACFVVFNQEGAMWHCRSCCCLFTPADVKNGWHLMTWIMLLRTPNRYPFVGIWFEKICRLLIFSSHTIEIHNIFYCSYIIRRDLIFASLTNKVADIKIQKTTNRTNWIKFGNWSVVCQVRCRLESHIECHSSVVILFF